jgi:hypothetical protein
MMVSNELEKIWMEAIVAYFNVRSRSFAGGIEENYE